MRDYVYSGGVHLWRKRLILSIIVTVPIIYIYLLDLFGDRIPLADVLSPWTTFIAFVAATIAMLYLGSSFFRSTIRGLQRRIFNMDSLITIGTLTAYLYSWISYLVYIIQYHTVLVSTTDQPQFYFETVVLLFTFVVFGKWLEARATSRAEQSIRMLVKLRPRQAHLINGGNIVTIPADQIQVGDRLSVAPGESIPVDGRVVGGSSSVNESMITGESVSVDKSIGSQVISGTTNGHGYLEVVAEKVGGDTMLARIVTLINSTSKNHTTIEGMADRLANVFVPFVIVVALITFAVWHYCIGIDTSSAMIMFITVIVVACPYAFGLAAPTAVTVGIDIGSDKGILIKNGRTLQQLSRVDTVVFDKTGTLTTGQPVVTDIIPLENSSKHALTLASSLERLSEHYLAKAIIKKADSQHLETLPVKNFVAIPGRGISGMIGSTKYYLGNEALARQYVHNDLPDTTKLTKASKAVNYLFTNHKIIAVIAVADQPKENAARTVKQLHQMKITTYLMSGDNEATTRAIARRLGIRNIIADTMPDTKAEKVIELRHQGHCVAMVGDGINDAPAIASANVGIAIGTGTEAAIETGDVVLVSGDPLAICNAIRLAKASVNKIRQNLFFSMFYNIISLPIAAGALSAWGILFQPELAGLIMVMSSLAVVVNSLTLRLTDITKQREPARYLAPIILFLLFTAVYIEFTYSSNINVML